MWMINGIQQDVFRSWGKTILAVLLGVGFASRPNFILLLPLVFSALAKSVGAKSAIKHISIIFLTLALFTIPFYIYDPSGFSPLHTANKLGQFQNILPLAGIIVPATSGIIAFLLSIYDKNNFLPILLRNCAIVLAFPVVSGVVLQSINAERLIFDFTGFGISFLFFGVVAFCPLHYVKNQNAA